VPAQFVLKKGTTGKFRFNLIARNGQVIATSEAYETKAKAMAGIESVRKNAPDATVVDGTAPAAKPAAKAATKSAAKPAKAATKTAATAARKPAAKAAAKPAARKATR
jgi:uncharacterized protein YegP (UPF0339 family)